MADTFVLIKARLRCDDDMDFDQDALFDEVVEAIDNTDIELATDEEGDDGEDIVLNYVLMVEDVSEDPNPKP